LNDESYISPNLHKDSSNIHSENKEIKCPRCGDKIIIRFGLRQGKQRYRCTKCNFFFVEDQKKPENLKQKMLDYATNLFNQRRTENDFSMLNIEEFLEDVEDNLKIQYQRALKIFRDLVFEGKFVCFSDGDYRTDLFMTQFTEEQAKKRLELRIMSEIDAEMRGSVPDGWYTRGYVDLPEEKQQEVLKKWRRGEKVEQQNQN